MTDTQELKTVTKNSIIKLQQPYNFQAYNKIICIQPPEKFNPQKDVFKKWVENFESFMEKHNTIRDEWIEVLKTMLVDSCREKVKYMFKKPNITYNEITNFLHSCSTKKSTQDALKEFCERKKSPKETYYQFASDLENFSKYQRINY